MVPQTPCEAGGRERGRGASGLKGIGEKLAGLIVEYVEKGEVELLQTLEKEVPPDKLKEVAAKKSEHTFAKTIELPVKVILDVDAEYRKKAAAGELKRIAPRLFNPEKKAWLPIMVTEQKGYKFTVMFSNTETATDWVRRTTGLLSTSKRVKERISARLLRNPGVR